MPVYSLLESTNGSAVLRRDGDHQTVVAENVKTEDARKIVQQANRRTFRVGDAFEWVAAAAFIAAGYIEYTSIPLALAIFGVALAYFAQCLANAEFKRPRLPTVPSIHPVKFAKAKLKRKAKHDTPPRPH